MCANICGQVKSWRKKRCNVRSNCSLFFQMIPTSHFFSTSRDGGTEYSICRANRCEQWLPLGGRNHFRIHTVLRSALCTSRSASLAACLFRARPFITHMTILADGNCLYPVIRTIWYAGPLSPTFTIIPRFPAIVASCLEQRPSNRNSVRKI